MTGDVRGHREGDRARLIPAGLFVLAMHQRWRGLWSARRCTPYPTDANVYPRSWPRLTATIPADTTWEFATKLPTTSLYTASAFPPLACAKPAAKSRVASWHTARCTPRLSTESSVLPRLGSTPACEAELYTLLVAGFLVCGSLKLIRCEIVVPYFVQMASLYANTVAKCRTTMTMAELESFRP